jgi:hypothetical protein
MTKDTPSERAQLKNTDGSAGKSRPSGKAAKSGKQSAGSEKSALVAETSPDDQLGGVPDFIRRLAAVGLSGFFTTEGALRKALGDTVPKDWVDFAAGQSERTQHELLDRLAGEFGKVLEHVDLTELMDQLLTGRTVEVTAQIRLAPQEGAQAKPAPAAPKTDRKADDE